MNISYIITGYLILINLITFLTYGYDKYKAKKDKWRVPEKTLILLAVFGGSIGALLGIKLFHHKTLHKKFKYGVPAILVAQLAIAGYLLYYFIYQ